MSFLTSKALSRRTVLRGLGATMALPFLDAMVPAATLQAKTAAAGKIRLSCIEQVHGAAGSTKIGLEKNMWSPAATGKSFDLTPTSLSSLEPYRDYLTIVSNTDVRNAEAFLPNEIGGDHFRSSAVFLTQAHPKQTEGSDVYVGPSIDQLYAQKFGQDTAIPSLQLCIENVDQSGGCAYGYACVYTDTVSWADAETPLPMIRDPRYAFDQLFGVGATPAERAARRRTDRSILDWMSSEVSKLRNTLGASDRARLDSYLTDIEEIERRIVKIEERNNSGEHRELPGAPAGVPDSFTEHVKLMYDLQALAFAGDITRVFTFKTGRDGSARVYPDSGVNLPFHPASHHGERDERVTQFAAINKYQVGLLPHFLDKLKSIKEGDSNLLDQTVIVYGSPMGNSNVHNHKRCPLFLVGRGGGMLKGGLHLKGADGTPMANVFLTLAHGLGLDLQSFGDSTGEYSLNSAPETTLA
jgi:hypothetical protein